MKKVTTDLTLSAIMEKLKRKQYDNEFVLTVQGFRAPSGKYYHPVDLKIIKTYSFPEQNNMYASHLFVLEANDGLIGYSLDSHEVFSQANGELYETFISRIPIQGRREEELF